MRVGPFLRSPDSLVEDPRVVCYVLNTTVSSKLLSPARKRPGGRGASLASTLMLVAVLVTLSFALAGVGVSNLSFTTRLESLEHGRALSESVIALATDHLRTDVTIGTPANRGGLLEMRPRTGPGRALLTFDPLLAARHSIPCSTNNLAGDVAVPGWGRAVPPASAHLVGCATVGGVTRNVEILLQMPAFPYAVAAGGNLRSNGNLLVGSVPEGADPTTLDEEELGPGNLLSNAPGSSSLVLGPNSRVTGDLRAGGEVLVDPRGSRVGGQVKQNLAPVNLPRLDVRDYDPVAQGRSQVRHLAMDELSDPALIGFVRRQGDLRIRDGLALDNGVLFVDGDLRIDDGVHGVGAIFVTGDTVLHGGSSLASDNQVALVSGGDVQIVGGPNSHFQGMLYSDRDFRATQVMVLGSLVARGSVVLNGVTLIQAPQATALDLVPGGMSELALPGGYRIPVRFDNPTFTVQNPLTLESQSGLTNEEAINRVMLVVEQVAGAAAVPTRDEVDAALRALVQSPPPAPVDPVQLDLSRFLPFEQRMKITLWRQQQE